MPDFMRNPRATALLWLSLLHFAMAARVSDYAIIPEHGVLFEMIPSHWRVVMWLTCGAVALLGATFRRWQTAGFVAAVAMPIERSLGYLWSWGETFYPAPPPGNPEGYLDALVWLMIVFLILTITRMGRPHRGDAHVD